MSELDSEQYYLESGRDFYDKVEKREKRGSHLKY